MEAGILKYKLIQTGCKIKRMIKCILTKVYLLNLIVRFCIEKAHKVVALDFAPENLRYKTGHRKPKRNLWVVPRVTGKFYVFCTDERIRMHKILGKPTHGLSPPELYQVNGISPVSQNKLAKNNINCIK